MQAIDTIFYIVILIMSVVIHEVSHGYAALYFGDQTAKHAGRLTLNPMKHLDPVGSVLIPLILIITNAGFIFGWAKPVPYNPHNLRNKKWGTIVVAAAGAASNLIIALIFGLLMRFSLALGIASAPFLFIVQGIVLINILLAIFNLIPIPPLDGSKILFEILPNKYRNVRMFMERYAIFFLLFFIFFLWQFIAPVIFFVYSLFTGLAF